jgi:hypothetical protein
MEQPEDISPILKRSQTKSEVVENAGRTFREGCENRELRNETHLQPA